MQTDYCVNGQSLHNVEKKKKKKKKKKKRGKKRKKVYNECTRTSV